MKAIYLSICLIFVFGSAFSQNEEPSKYKMVTDRFVMFYNASKYDSIFNMFGQDMKNALPFDKTKEFLQGLKKQVGGIVKKEYKKNTGVYVSYKTNFDMAVLSMNISLNEEGKINGLNLKPYKDEDLPKIERNTTALILPFKGEWFVFWGGDTKELNYHVVSEAQKNAFDFLIKDATGKSYQTTGQSNEDYYAFGKEIIAPCEGEVVLAVDGVKDNVPGVLNPIYVPGNTVIIKTFKNEYLFFAHFKQFSIQVKQGQIVKQGQPLGLCGNSGNSSEPHLHFHIQNVEDMNVATGAKCYFSNILVNGQPKNDYSPIKGEKIKQE